MKTHNENSLRHCIFKSYPNSLCVWTKNKSASNLFGYIAKVLNIYFFREPNEEDAIARRAFGGVRASLYGGLFNICAHIKA